MLEKPRKRLYRKYRRFGSWRALALDLSDQAGFEINVRYPWDFVTNGIVPNNKAIQNALGIPSRIPKPVTINQLMQLPIQDMPTLILRLAFENRQEM